MTVNEKVNKIIDQCKEIGDQIEDMKNQIRIDLVKEFNRE